MTLFSYNAGQTVTTETGQKVTLTNTSDPTCLIGIGANGEEVRVRRSEVSNPIFNTYQEKLAKLEKKYEGLQVKYRETCNNSEEFADAISYHCHKKDNILRDAGTVSWSNLEGKNRAEFDSHYDLYWGARFDLTASYNQEYHLTRAIGDTQLQMAKLGQPFGLA